MTAKSSADCDVLIIGAGLALSGLIALALRNAVAHERPPP